MPAGVVQRTAQANLSVRIRILDTATTRPAEEVQVVREVKVTLRNVYQRTANFRYHSHLSFSLYLNVVSFPFIVKTIDIGCVVAYKLTNERTCQRLGRGA